MKRPSPEMLIAAYSQGIFPMAFEDQGWEVYWYAPDPRTIMPLDEGFHVSRSLQRTLRRGVFEIRYDTAFREVMEACAEPRGDDGGRWISPHFIDAYTELHELGFAHSIEAWHQGELAGGLYGVAIGGLFAGESMFHRVTDASKVSLVATVERLRERGYLLFDVQFTTSHLKRFGATEISKQTYERRARLASRMSVSFDG